MWGFRESNEQDCWRVIALYLRYFSFAFVHYLKSDLEEKSTYICMLIFMRFIFFEGDNLILCVWFYRESEVVIFIFSGKHTH